MPEAPTVTDHLRFDAKSVVWIVSGIILGGGMFLDVQLRISAIDAAAQVRDGLLELRIASLEGDIKSMRTQNTAELSELERIRNRLDMLLDKRLK
jgi:outer membrane murein-binding lipoprotein Lpp